MRRKITAQDKEQSIESACECPRAPAKKRDDSCQFGADFGARHKTFCTQIKQQTYRMSKGALVFRVFLVASWTCFAVDAL